MGSFRKLEPGEKPPPLAADSHLNEAEGPSEAAGLASARRAGAASLVPPMGPLPEKADVDASGRYAIALTRPVPYRGRMLQPGRSLEVAGALLLDDMIREAASGAAKLR